MQVQKKRLVQFLIFSFLITMIVSWTPLRQVEAAGGSFWSGSPVITEAFSETKWTKKDIIITVKASSPTGPITRIELPDGTQVEGDTVNYGVTENGVYPFVAYDKSGDMTGKFIEVKNIDKDNPSVEMDVPADWKNEDINVELIGKP